MNALLPHIVIATALQNCAFVKHATMWFVKNKSSKQLQISTIYSYFDEIYLLGEVCQTNTVEQYGLSELRQSKLI